MQATLVLLTDQRCWQARVEYLYSASNKGACPWAVEAEVFLYILYLYHRVSWTKTKSQNNVIIALFSLHPGHSSVQGESSVCYIALEIKLVTLVTVLSFPIQVKDAASFCLKGVAVHLFIF